MTEHEADKLGQMVDRLSNILAGQVIPVPAEIHLKGMVPVIREVRDELKMFVVSQGHDFWGDEPND